jgi:hypothetical protein
VAKGPLDTPLKLALVFGGMGLLCALGVTLIVSRTVFAKPQVVPSEAEESYKQGLRMFGTGDYDGAKINFKDAATQAPDAPEPQRYLKQCDAELHARGLVKSAERALAARHYGEAVRDAEQVEDGTQVHDQAARIKRESAPRAAIEEVEDAKRSMATDPPAAQARLMHALELDPGNAEARALLPRLKSGKPVAVAAVVKEPPSEPPAPKQHVVKEKQPLIPLAKEPKPAPGPAVSVGESKGAMALYKNKDFAGAVKQARLEAMAQPTKQSDKTMALMNQLKLVQAAVDRATGEETRSPAEAVKDYNEAMNLDQKLLQAEDWQAAAGGGAAVVSAGQVRPVVPVGAAGAEVRRRRRRHAEAAGVEGGRAGAKRPERAEVERQPGQDLLADGLQDGADQLAGLRQGVRPHQ